MSVNFVHGVGWRREEPDIEHEPEMKKQHISIQIPERVVCTAEEVVGFSNEYPSMIEVKIEADLLFDWSDVFHGDGSVWRWVSVNQTNLEGRNVELPVGNKTHQNGRVFLQCPPLGYGPYTLQVRNQGFLFQSNELDVQVLLGEQLDTTKANAKLEDGVLTVTIPVSAKAKGRSIKIS